MKRTVTFGEFWLSLLVAGVAVALVSMPVWFVVFVLALAGSAWCLVWLHDSFESEFEWDTE